MSAITMERSPTSVPGPTAGEVPAAPGLQGDTRDAEIVRCRRVAFQAALQLVGHREDAMDLAQEAVLRVLRSAETLDPGRSWHPYVLRVVTNLARDLWRRRQHRRAESLDALLVEHGFDAPDAEAGPERRAIAQDERRHVVRALGVLDTDHREILVLRDFQDLSYADIATVLRIPVGTVMSRLHRARLALREALGRGAGRRS